MNANNGFEKTPDGNIVITGDGISAYRLMALIKSLEIEVKTGMKMSRGTSPLKIAQTQYGVKSRTKKGAVEELKNIFNESYQKGFYE